MPFPSSQERANKKLWIAGVSAVALIGFGIGIGLIPSEKKPTDSNENSLAAWPSREGEGALPQEAVMSPSAGGDRLYGASTEAPLSFENLMDVLAQEQAKPPAKEFAREFMKEPVLRKTWEDFRRTPKKSARDFLFTVRGTSEFRHLMARFASDPGFRSFLASAAQRPEIGRLIKEQERMDASRAAGAAKGRSVLNSSLSRLVPGGVSGSGVRSFQGATAAGQSSFSGDAQGNSVGFSAGSVAQPIDAGGGGAGAIGASSGAGSSSEKSGPSNAGSNASGSWGGSGRRGAGGVEDWKNPFASVWGQFCKEIQEDLITCTGPGMGKSPPDCCDAARACKDGSTCKEICTKNSVCNIWYKEIRDKQIAKCIGTSSDQKRIDCCNANPSDTQCAQMTGVTTPEKTQEKKIEDTKTPKPGSKEYCYQHPTDRICDEFFKCSVCQGEPSRLPADVLHDCDFNCPGWRPRSRHPMCAEGSSTYFADGCNHDCATGKTLSCD